MRNFVRRAGALAALFLAATSAPASTPTLMWQGATALGVQCLVERLPYRNDAALGAQLCARVAKLAGARAPMPVRVLALGDAQLLAPGAVTLLVHGSVEPMRGGRALAFAIRPFRASTDQNAVLFGAAPRAVPLTGAGLSGPALDAALTAALAETLPWQARPQGARPLPTRN